MGSVGIMRRNRSGMTRTRTAMGFFAVAGLVAALSLLAILATAGRSNAATDEVRFQIAGDGNGGASALPPLTCSYKLLSNLPMRLTL